jgi:hypothetical protein
MSSLVKLLAGRRGGVYRLLGEDGRDEAERRAQDRGLWFGRADLSRARTAAGLHAALARALRFPAHYGKNWDALADCLGDLSWLEGPGWVLLLDGADGLAAASPDDLATALEVLRSAAASWAEEGRPFVALLRGEKLPRMPAIG